MIIIIIIIIIITTTTTTTTTTTIIIIIIIIITKTDEMGRGHQSVMARRQRLAGGPIGDSEGGQVFEKQNKMK